MNCQDILFASGTVHLAGALTLPRRQGAGAAVILLPGSGHHDRDETLGSHKPLRTIALHLAGGGIVSLRFDGRGVGASGGDTGSVSFATKVADALAARDHLITRCGIAARRLAFVGHSEGGLVAAAASAERPTAVAMLAGPAVPIPDLLHKMARAQALTEGATEAQIAHAQTMNDLIFATALSDVGRGVALRAIIPIIIEALKSWPDQSWPETQMAEAAKAMADIVLAEDFRSLLRQDPAAVLARMRAPILGLFGELDCQVAANANLEAFQAATQGQAMARAETLPGHNHLFQVAVTGQIEEYETLAQSPSPQALAILTDWLKSALAPVSR